MIFTLMYHKVHPLEFENDLFFLKANGYRTVKADELYLYLKNGIQDENVIALTFDDGHRSLWLTAYPLLKKYKMHGIAFVIPSRIEHIEKRYISARFNSRMFNRMNNTPGVCSWEELEEMQSSGYLDIQSHSYYHALVFQSPQIVDFISPSHFNGFDNRSSNILVKINDKNILLGKESFGAPIYEHRPLLNSDKIYYDDEDFRSDCIHFVKSMGKDFFTDASWRNKMWEFVHTKYPNNIAQKGFIDTKMEDLIEYDVSHSKMMIEKKLKNKVEHFCFPFGAANNISMSCIERSNFKVFYEVRGFDNEINYKKFRLTMFPVARYNGDKGDAFKVLGFKSKLFYYTFNKLCKVHKHLLR